MQLLIQDIDLKLIPLDMERFLSLKVVLEDGQIFEISERDNGLDVRSIGVNKSVVIAPIASNAVIVRAAR